MVDILRSLDWMRDTRTTTLAVAATAVHGLVGAPLYFFKQLELVWGLPFTANMALLVVLCRVVVIKRRLPRWMLTITIMSALTVILSGTFLGVGIACPLTAFGDVALFQVVVGVSDSIGEFARRSSYQGATREADGQSATTSTPVELQPLTTRFGRAYPEESW